VYLQVPPAEYSYYLQQEKNGSKGHELVTNSFEREICAHAAQCSWSQQSFKPVRSRDLPDLRVAQTGEPLEQVISVDMTKTAFKASSNAVQQAALVEGCINAFMLDFSQLDCPRSWTKAAVSEQAPEWKAGDDVEMKRMDDFKAYSRISLEDALARGFKIEHLLRILRVKPDELKVRWAYDEARATGEKDFETYASVMRTQTSCLLNLKAARLGRRVMRGDLTSAFLHVVADEPFCTYFPEGRPEATGEVGTGPGQSPSGRYVMLWHKLVYGKGNAPRGLRQDMKATLEALGFVEQRQADECLYVHQERQIDLGLYVDDIEFSGSEESMKWLQSQLKLRYLIKFLGYNSKDCDESSEKSKTYVGIRTEIDHKTKIVTRDQEALIVKASRKFEWDGRPRYNTPTTKGLKLMPETEKLCPKFHSKFRGKVGFLSHVALHSRPDVAFHAVELARQLVRPSVEADKFADETLQYLFSTADQKLTYDCKQDLHKTLLISSDASLADTYEAKTTGGWVSMCGGAAWAWQVETLRLQVLSSTEAEYCETANACKEVIAQKRLFEAFNLEFPHQYLVLVDNQSAIALACGPAVHYQRTKHIDTKFHFQRQLMLEGVIRLQHQATDVLFSDILTKALGKNLHKQHRRVLFGQDPIVIKSIKLPESQKLAVRRHNELIKERQEKDRLQQAFEAENRSLNQSSDPVKAALVASVQALLACVA